MFILDILFSFAIAIILTIVFSVVWRRTGPWDNIIIFFVVLFLSTWAGGLWVGTNWLGFLYTGLIIALLLAITTPKNSAKSSTVEIRNQKDLQAQKKTALTLKMFFWVWVSLLLVAIVVSYII